MEGLPPRALLTADPLVAANELADETPSAQGDAPGLGLIGRILKTLKLSDGEPAKPRYEKPGSDQGGPLR